MTRRTTPILCARCGNPIEPKRRKYCKACADWLQNHYHRASRPGVPLLTLVCHCGAAFTQEHAKQGRCRECIQLDRRAHRIRKYTPHPRAPKPPKAETAKPCKIAPEIVKKSQEPPTKRMDFRREKQRGPAFPGGCLCGSKSHDLDTDGRCPECHLQARIELVAQQALANGQKGYKALDVKPRSLNHKGALLAVKF